MCKLPFLLIFPLYPCTIASNKNVPAINIKCCNKVPPPKTFKDLPVEVIEYQLEDDEKICDICGNPLSEMKKEIRREL
ncbi:MAG: hypothetical protein R3Y24_12770, partial [Eubacteriales bacterium]